MLIAPNMGTDTLNPLFPNCLYNALEAWLAIVVTVLYYEQEMGTMKSFPMRNWIARSIMIFSIGDAGG